MRIIDMALRPYTRPEVLEETIAFYEAAQGIACERRFENREKRLSGARVGHVLILAGIDAAIASLRDVSAVFYVDDLDAFGSWLAANGADILHPPQATPFGRSMIARNPDGLFTEYFEAAGGNADQNGTANVTNEVKIE